MSAESMKTARAAFWLHRTCDTCLLWRPTAQRKGNCRAQPAHIHTYESDGCDKHRPAGQEPTP